VDRGIHRGNERVFNGSMTVRYAIPGDWARYDRLAVIEELALAKAAILERNALLSVSPGGRDAVTTG
jgi:hypothetical protein